MSDSEISSLNSSAFTSTTGGTVVTGPVAQRTRNIKTRRRERVIPQPSIPIRHPRLPDNSGNATEPLAPIFLPNVPRRQIGHVPASTQITRESVHHAMGIVDDDNDSLELDSSNKQDPVYDNSEDEARLDPEAAAGAEENSDESEGQNPLEGEDEVVLAEPAGRRQVRADIYSQISILSVNRCEYFKCNTCPQQYKRSAGTKNICDHLLKRHGWTSLTGVQNKRKRENKSIKDVVKRMGPAVEERRDAIWKELLSESLDKETLEYLFVQTVILCDLPFNLVQNHTFCWCTD